MRSPLRRLIKANGDKDTIGMRLFYIFLLFAVMYFSGHVVLYLLRHNYHLLGY